MKKIIMLICMVMSIAVSAQAYMTVHSYGVSTFSGGDAGEGLDLDGAFYIAVDAGSTTGGMVRDANFIEAPGFPIYSDDGRPQDPTPQNGPGPETVLVPDFGDTTNDNILETISDSRRWSNTMNGPIAGSFNSLTGGQKYKMQIGFQLGDDFGTPLCMDLSLFEYQSSGKTTILENNFLPSESDTTGDVLTVTFTTDPDQTFLRFYINPGDTYDPNTPEGYDDRYPAYHFVTLEAIPPCEALIASGNGLDMDFDEDCHVDINDMALFVADWLRCNDPDNPDCDDNSGSTLDTVGKWEMNEGSGTNIADSLAANNGTIDTPSYVLWSGDTTGASGLAGDDSLDFTDTTARVTIPDSSAYTFGTKSFAIGLDVNIDPAFAGTCSLFATNGAGPVRCQVWMQSATVYCDWDHGDAIGKTFLWFSRSEIQKDYWVHVDFIVDKEAGTSGNGVLSAVVDGDVVASTELLVDMGFDGAGDILIGNSGTDSFIGSIDNFEISVEPSP